MTDHRRWGVHNASWTSHGYVELGSSHLDHSDRKEGRKFEKIGKGHVVETGGKEGKNS